MWETPVMPAPDTEDPVSENKASGVSRYHNNPKADAGDLEWITMLCYL